MAIYRRGVLEPHYVRAGGFDCPVPVQTVPYKDISLRPIARKSQHRGIRCEHLAPPEYTTYRNASYFDQYVACTSTVLKRHPSSRMTYFSAASSSWRLCLKGGVECDNKVERQSNPPPCEHPLFRVNPEIKPLVLAKSKYSWVTAWRQKKHRCSAERWRGHHSTSAIPGLATYSV